MSGDEAIKEALDHITHGGSLITAIRQAYVAGYREGDLDRQRLTRSEREAKRAKRRTP